MIGRKRTLDDWLNSLPSDLRKKSLEVASKISLIIIE
jgi:hypothetical protein